MGLLSKLLTSPVAGPLSGAIWVMQKVAEAAEGELYDPARIRAALDELERAVDAGEIDEATYDAAEELLMQRLAKSSARGTT